MQKLGRIKDCLIMGVLPWIPRAGGPTVQTLTATGGREEEHHKETGSRFHPFCFSCSTKELIEKLAGWAHAKLVSCFCHPLFFFFLKEVVTYLHKLYYIFCVAQDSPSFKAALASQYVGKSGFGGMGVSETFQGNAAIRVLMKSICPIIC